MFDLRYGKRAAVMLGISAICAGAQQRERASLYIGAGVDARDLGYGDRWGKSFNLAVTVPLESPLSLRASYSQADFTAQFVHPTPLQFNADGTPQQVSFSDFPHLHQVTIRSASLGVRESFSPVARVHPYLDAGVGIVELEWRYGGSSAWPQLEGGMGVSLDVTARAGLFAESHLQWFSASDANNGRTRFIIPLRAGISLR